jgi:hypothetical protein
MLSAFILYVRGYPTMPAFMPTIGTLEERRSKSFRTKDPSRFNYSSVWKIGTILTPYVVTSMAVIATNATTAIHFCNRMDYIILPKK